MLETADIVDIYQILNQVHHIIDGVFNPRSTSKDKGNRAALGRVFAEDIEYDCSYRGLPVAHGLRELAEVMAGSYSRERSNLWGHHAMNFYVYEEDGQVKVHSKQVSFFSDGPSVEGAKGRTNDFHDVLVKTADGWRIKQRVATTRMPDAVAATPIETIEHIKANIGG